MADDCPVRTADEEIAPVGEVVVDLCDASRGLLAIDGFARSSSARESCLSPIESKTCFQTKCHSSHRPDVLSNTECYLGNYQITCPINAGISASCSVMFR